MQVRIGVSFESLQVFYPPSILNTFLSLFSFSRSSNQILIFHTNVTKNPFAVSLQCSPRLASFSDGVVSGHCLRRKQQRQLRDAEAAVRSGSPAAVLRLDGPVYGQGREDHGGDADGEGARDYSDDHDGGNGAAREARARRSEKRRPRGTGEAGQVDERVGGGDREEFEGGAAAGAGFSQIGDDGDGEEGGGGGLAGGEGAVGIRRDAGSGGIDIRGGVGRGHGGGRWRREDDEGVGGGGSGEGRRVRSGLLSFKDLSGRVRTR